MQWTVGLKVELTPVARVVAASSNRAWLVLSLMIALTVVAGAYSVRHFAMTTDSLDLISPDSAWRRNKAAFDRAFPDSSDLIVMVVDGVTPELADRGAAELTATLSKRADLFASVRQPDGGPFFERNGLLFLPVAEVSSVTRQIITAEPFLGPIAADPSLRGVMGALSTALEGVEAGQARLDDLDSAVRAIAASLERVTEAKPASFSWQTLVLGKAESRRAMRRIVLAQPRLDNTTLEPGAVASDAIRQAARALHLDGEDGVTVRLTGSVVIADEEFATLAEHAWLIAGAMIAAILVMLHLAVQSARIIVCILVTTVTGLVLTAGAGLLAVGRFNVISVAFVPLFVGLGIDFAIQFSVRYRAERHRHSDLKQALTVTGTMIGGSLALAAAAVALGFFGFLPTAYVGAAELGLIAGIGMVIAFILSITLLPALLTLVRPGGEPAPVGFAFLAPVDAFLLRRRRIILAGAVVVAAAASALLPAVRFDANPLDLRSAKTEAVSTLRQLAADPDRTPNVIDVLAPSLADADTLAKRFRSLPEIARAVTLSSFVPDDQREKLRLIEDAASLLAVVLDPIEVRPEPTDRETVAALSGAADALRQAGGDGGTSAQRDALRLSAVLAQLAKAAPDARRRAAETLVAPLTAMLARMRAMLQPEPVTLQTLPPELVRDWVAADGRARIELSPAGDQQDGGTLQRFARAVQRIAPTATGAPISIDAAAILMTQAFAEAGLWSFLAVALLLAVVLRGARDVALTLAPVMLMGLLTLASCALLDEPLNFANIIALPLLFGIGIAFNIYFVMAWRSGRTNLLQSSLARAVLFSALATGMSFGSLWMSSHPGTASMGRLLMIALGWTLATTLLIQPALLGPPPADRD